MRIRLGASGASYELARPILRSSLANGERVEVTVTFASRERMADSCFGSRPRREATVTLGEDEVEALVQQFQDGLTVARRLRSAR